MLKKLLTLFLFLHYSVFAADPRWKRIDMPPLLPQNIIIENAVLVTECGFYATKKASGTNVLFTPLSPCVGIRVCNANNSEECVDAHIHSINSLHALQKTIDKNITSSNSSGQKNIQLMLFTRTDENEFENWRFTEGSHAKRVESIIKTIESDYNVVEKNSLL